MEQKQYLNVGVDYALWGKLQAARLAYMVVKRMGWHDFLHLAWERGAEALVAEVQRKVEDEQKRADRVADAMALSENERL